MSVVAPTYDPQDALNALKPQLSNVILDTTAQGIVCDLAHKDLWNIWPWRWTKKVLPDITLIDIQQDYTGTSLPDVPTDFLTLLQASVVRTDTTPDIIYDLDIKNWLAQDAVSSGAIPRWVAFHHELNSAGGGFRLLPVPAVPSGQTWVLRGVYKMNPATKYSSANLTTNFTELPDVYFPVYCEVLLWEIYRYVGDARAGNVVVSRNGQRNYSGQLGKAMSSIQMMLEAEDVGDTQTIFPAEPLGHYRPFARVLFP